MKKLLSVQKMIELVPLLAPLPTAWVVGSAMVRVMGWPWPVAVIGALIIEGLGFGTVDTAMRMREWNKSRRQRFDVNAKATIYVDPAAPTFYAMIILVVYLVVALALTVLMDMVPGLALFARGVFPFLGVLGAALWALRADHERREAKKEADKQELREERRAAREAKLADKNGQPSRKGGGSTREASRKGATTEELLAYWREHPQASDGEVGKHFGVEKQAIWQRRTRLIKLGTIHWDKERGVEVVGIDTMPSASTRPPALPVGQGASPKNGDRRRAPLQPLQKREDPEDIVAEIEEGSDA